MFFELTNEQIAMVDGGAADFSGVTAKVDSTAEIVDGNKSWARQVLLWMVIR